MAAGTNADPVIIDPTNLATSAGWKVQVKLLRDYFVRDDYDVREFIDDVSPLIRDAVGPGECFAFTVNTAIVFRLDRDERGDLYFVRWPSLSKFPKYHLTDEQTRPWVPDVVGAFNRRVRELNPFSAIDRFME